MKIQIKSEWVWYGYYLYYLFVTLTSSIYFFRPDYPINLFYQILIAYDISYLSTYLFNALAVILNGLSLLPFYLFLRKKVFLSTMFWRVFFVMRLALDLTCRNYEMNQIKSLLHHDKTIASLLIITFIALNLPSYIAIFVYAFRYRK